MAPDDQRARLHANGSLCVVLREPDGTFTATVTHKDHGGHRDLRLPSQDAAMKACDAEIALQGHTCTEECDSW
jgi:hypothetical protein